MVVAILGVLAVLALPSFREMLIERRLKGAAEAIQSDLMFARSEAVRRNAVMHVRLATGSSGCLGLGTAACTSCRPDAAAGRCDLKTLDLSPTSGEFPNVQLSAASSSAFHVTAIRGTPSVSTPSVTVGTTSGSDRRVTVSLSPLGMAKMCTPTGNVSGLSSC